MALVIELLVSPITGGIFGLVGLILGKQLDSRLKAVAEAKAVERKEAIEYRQQLDERHNMFFDAFVKEQRNAAVAFEGIHQSVAYIGKEIEGMRIESQTQRKEIFSRLGALEQTIGRHDGLLESLRDKL